MLEAVIDVGGAEGVSETVSAETLKASIIINAEPIFTWFKKNAFVNVVFTKPARVPIAANAHDTVN